MARILKDLANGQIDYTPSSDLDAGDVVVESQLVGVVANAITSGEKGSLCVWGEVEFTKSTASGSAIARGDRVYINSSTKVVSETSTDVACGICAEAATDSSSTVKVLLNFGVSKPG